MKFKSFLIFTVSVIGFSVTGDLYSTNFSFFKAVSAIFSFKRSTKKTKLQNPPREPLIRLDSQDKNNRESIFESTSDGNNNSELKRVSTVSDGPMKITYKSSKFEKNTEENSFSEPLSEKELEQDEKNLQELINLINKEAKNKLK